MDVYPSLNHVTKSDSNATVQLSTKTRLPPLEGTLEFTLIIVPNMSTKLGLMGIVINDEIVDELCHQ